MKNTFKTLGAIIVVIIVVILVIISVRKSPSTTQVADTGVKNLCFYSENRVNAGYADIAWLRVMIDGEKVSGELRNLPAEKDSKVGLFDGTLSSNADGTQKIDAIWQTRAEGMETPEQLFVKLSADKAEVAYGEMVDRGDGTYIYKTPDAIGYWQSIPAVDCSDLNDRVVVEKYVRDNIRSISPIKAEMGGNWYVVNVTVDPKAKSGTVTYEDGHVQKKSTFSYSVSGDQVSITNFNAI